MSSHLIRDATKVYPALKEMQDGRVVVSKSTRIQIPARWSDRYLATVGVENYVTGVMAIIVDDMFYAVSNICAQFRLVPDKVSIVTINETEYYDFYFEPGSTIFESTDLLRQDTLVYYLFDEVITKGNVPWYMGYEDLGKMLDSAEKYAGTSLAKNRELNELITSLIARSPKDRTDYFRVLAKGVGDIMSPDYVALSSVSYSATSTLSKIAGAYMSEGMTSALVNPSTKIERIESLLRA